MVSVNRIPILAHHCAEPSRGQTARVERLAASLASEQPELSIRDAFRPLRPNRIEDAPALHIDDLSTIVQIDRFYDVSFLEDRARFRATAGEFVASCGPPNPEFQAYCQDQLGLGIVRWLHPRARENRLRVAPACWTDRDVRHELIRAVRNGDLRYVHPHMGNFPVWATALLLRRASRRPLFVIAPHPGLTKRVNDKLWFAATVSRLLGERSIPPTAAAYSLSTVAHLVRQLAPQSRSIVIKLPGSAGGAGNLVIKSKRLRARRLGDLRRELKHRLVDLSWTGEGPVLVGTWETEVLTAPSAQLWIPPELEGAPIVEGLFEQLIEGPGGYFVGSRAAALPSDLTQEIATRCWLLGKLFQHLGYVGRCSFDMLLVGKTLERCEVQFTECNGRWGGTSLPMTLMNRLFGDWCSRPYATSICRVPGLERVSFAKLLEHFAGDLFDERSGCGRFIFYNPGGIHLRGGIDVLALADTWEAAIQCVRREIPGRLRALIRRLGIRSSRWGQIR